VDALALLSGTAAEDGHAAEASRLRGRAIDIWFKVSSLDDVDDLERFGLPPHQQAADVCSGRGIAGRGGWSWYTGAAARMLDAAHAMLGIRFVRGEAIVTPDASGDGARVQLVRVSFRGREWA
jgi:cyclic beta-1,2-glucan synthetase